MKRKIGKNHPLRFDNLHESFSLNLSNKGSSFSILLRLLITRESACLKKRGASSTNHFGSIAVHSRMYSFDVKTNSW